MKIAVMQPYFFPYIGYFQLINSVDKFVFLDDVTYINKGWINRNRILAHGKALDFVIPLIGASQNKKINEITVDINSKLLEKFRKSLSNSYKKNIPYKSVIDLIDCSLSVPSLLLSEITMKSVIDTSKYLGLSCEFLKTSDLNISLRGEDRIIAICEKLSAREYWNLPGGIGLYDQKNFQHKNLTLHFIEPYIQPYNQKLSEFIPSLSVIDILMSEDPKNIQKKHLLGTHSRQESIGNT